MISGEAAAVNDRKNLMTSKQSFDWQHALLLETQITDEEWVWEVFLSH